MAYFVSNNKKICYEEYDDKARRSLKLFHVGFNVIEAPDIYYGKKNADFGQGFYLSDDVIIGPIANDTIYDVMGITTSGYLEDKEALQLLQAGPVYYQVAIKSHNANKQLKWLGYEQLKESEILGYRAVVEEEEKKFQAEFAERLSQITE